jgi:hypothetical protein
LLVGWVHEYFGNIAPASADDRIWLVWSLAQLGRFAEAAEYEAEAIRLAEPPKGRSLSHAAIMASAGAGGAAPP